MEVEIFLLTTVVLLAITNTDGTIRQTNKKEIINTVLADIYSDVIIYPIQHKIDIQRDNFVNKVRKLLKVTDELI